MCKNEDCHFYPQYGVAPHVCYWRKEGGFEANPLGTSTILPAETWPNNFLAEIDPSESVEKQLSWGLCGVYFCPDCLKGYGVTRTLWDRAAILSAMEAQ